MPSIFRDFLICHNQASIHFILHTCREKMNSMDLLRYMAPVAVILLVPATLIMEREAFGVVVTLAREDPNFIWILLCNSSMAYFVNLTNFLVTKHTSPLTLQVIQSSPFQHCYAQQLQSCLLLRTILEFSRQTGMQSYIARDDAIVLTCLIVIRFLGMQRALSLLWSPS